MWKEFCAYLLLGELAGALVDVDVRLATHDEREASADTLKTIGECQTDLHFLQKSS